MADLNPGMGMHQGFGGVPGGGSPLGAGGRFSVDSNDLVQLHTRLSTITKDIGLLDKAVGSLVNSLKEAGKHLGPLTGGRGAGGTQGGSGLTVGNVSAGGGRGQQPGMSGAPNTNTAAPVSPLGKVANALAFGAAGELVANAAGSANNFMGGITSAGAPINLMAAQQNAFFGRNTGQRGTTVTSAAIMGISNLSQQDAAAAQSTLMSNAFLMTGQGSRNQKNLFGFMNATQRLNPAMGAAGAAQFANTLASPGAAWMFQRYGGAQTGGLINPHGGINTPQQTFQMLMRVITRNTAGPLTPAKLKQMAGDNQLWIGIAQNFGQGTMMNLSPAELNEMRQYAASGGNLNAAGNAMSQTGAAGILGRTTATSRLKQTVYQQSVPAQNQINALIAGGANAANAVAESGPGGAAITASTYIAKLGTTSLSTAAHLAELDAALKIILGGRVAGAGGGGLIGALGRRLGITGLGAATAEGAGAAAAGGGTGMAAVGAAGAGAYVLGGNAGYNAITKHLPGQGSVAGRAATGFAIGSVPVIGTALSGGHAITTGAKDLWHLAFGDPTPFGENSTAGLDPTMKKRMSAMMAANPNVKITSGHRNSAQQANVYGLKGPGGAVRPGQSAHQHGKAADVGPPSQFAWISRNAGRFGLFAPAPGQEPWHLQSLGDVTGAQVVAGAQGMLGTPYAWGGESAKGVDCSGLVQMVFAKLGISLPRTSQAQASAGSPVGSLAQAQPGDIIVYSEPGEGPNSHVAIYIGGGKQIAAPYTGQVVRVENVDTPHISTIRRVVGGGAGSAAAQAAQSAVGTPSNDSSNHSGAHSTSLANTFLAQVKGSWLSGGGGAAGGAPPSASVTSNTATTGSAGASGNTTMMSGAVGSISSPTDFSKAVLAGLGIGASVADVTNLNAWQQHEGQWTVSSPAYMAQNMHDPLNTNLSMPGSKQLSGTMSYPTWAEGIAATISTIKQGNMAPILQALQSNDNLSSFSKALESTPWAASAYGGQSFAQPSGVYAVGDPTGGMRMGSSAMVRRPGGGGGNTFHLHMPVQLASSSKDDAQRLVHMVMAELRSQAGLAVVSEGG